MHVKSVTIPGGLHVRLFIAGLSKRKKQQQHFTSLVVDLTNRNSSPKDISRDGN